MSHSCSVRPILNGNRRSFATALWWHLLYAIIPMQTPIAAGMIVAALGGEAANFYGWNPSRDFGVSTQVFAVGLFAGLAIATSVAAYFRNISTAQLSRRVVATLRIDALEASVQMEPGHFDRLGAVEVQDRIVNETAQVRRYIERVFVQTGVNLVRVSYPVIMLFVIDVQLAFVAVAIMTPQLVISLFVLSRLHEATRLARERRAVLNRGVADLVRRSSDNSGNALASVREKVLGLEQAEMTAQRFAALNMSNVWLFTCFGIAMVWWFGAAAVSSGRLGVGELVAFVGMLSFVYQPMRQFTQIANTSRRGTVALQRLDELYRKDSDDAIQPSRDIRILSRRIVDASDREAS